jgi:hypothetical protein
MATNSIVYMSISSAFVEMCRNFDKSAEIVAKEHIFAAICRIHSIGKARLTMFASKVSKRASFVKYQVW